MNSLFQQLHQDQASQAPPLQKSLQQPLKNNSLLQNVLNSSNPMELIQKMVLNNPKMQNVMNLYKASGMSPKQFFYQFAQQKGVNPDEFLNSLK